MSPLSKTPFQKFFKNPNGEKYFFYAAASNKFHIREHIHFLSQIAHESNYLKRNQESHQYSAERLLQIFPKYFKTIEQATEYQRSPRIFDRTYASRMGNGAEESRDGSIYKGRSYIQLTGRNNYKKFGYEDRPEKILMEKYNWEVCFQYWIAGRFDDLITGNDENDIKKVTRRLNGGYIGLSHRKQCYFSLKKMLNQRI